MSGLIVQDLAGTHNADLAGSRARLVRGGSWKRQRVIVVIPSAELMPARVALSLWNLAFPPNNPCLRTLALGQEVGEAYSSALASVLEHPELGKWEYLLTCEHDNLPPGDGLLRLLERMESPAGKNFAAIGGLYFTKGPGGVAQIWGDPKDPVLNFRPQPPALDGSLVECNGTGMGFTLFRLKMFRDPKLRRPWFKTETKNGIGTQDLYFWGDARKHGHRCAVDCSVKVGHLDHDGSFGPPGKVW